MEEAQAALIAELVAQLKEERAERAREREERARERAEDTARLAAEREERQKEREVERARRDKEAEHRRAREALEDARRAQVKVTEPSKINGKDPVATTDFIFKLNNYFGSRSSEYKKDLDKIRFAIGLLEGGPLQVLSTLQDTRSGVYKVFMMDPDKDSAGLEDERWELFSVWLRRMYGEKDVEGKARRDLESLKQTGTAAAFCQQISAIFGRLCDYPLERRLETAERKLKPGVRRWLVSNARKFSTWEEWVEAVVTFDNKMNEIEADEKAETGGSAANVAKKEQPAASVAKKDPPPVPWRAGGGKGVSDGRGESGWKPMRPGVWARSNEQQREAMSSDGACFFCGKRGHIRAFCPEEAGLAGAGEVKVKAEPVEQGQAGKA